MNRCAICQEVIKDDNPRNSDNPFKHDRDCPKHPGAIARRNYELLQAAAFIYSAYPHMARPEVISAATSLLQDIEERTKTQ